MMKKILLSGILMLFAITGVFAQPTNAPVTEAEKVVVSMPYPTTVTVDVSVTDFILVDVVSLSFLYDNSIMTYDGFDLHPTLVAAGWAPTEFDDNGNVKIGFFAPVDPNTNTSTPVTFNGTETLLTLKFTGYNGGTSMITWVNDPTSESEYAGPDAAGNTSGNVYIDNPTEDFYKNGYVTDIATTLTSSVTVCETPNYAEINITASGGSGSFIYKIDDGTPVTNTNGEFTITGAGDYTYEVSVIDAAFPAVELILDPALNLVVPSVEGYIYNPRTYNYYCTLQDAINDAIDNDEIHFVYPNTYSGLTWNDPNFNLNFINIQNDYHGPVVFEGASPALSLAAGTLSFDGVTFTTASDDPTIDITGGKLILRNCTIIESTGYVQTGISITGGELDAGLVGDPGRNVFVADGIGRGIIQSGSSVANAICNYYGSTQFVDVTFMVQGDVAFDPWNDATLNNCIFSQDGGPITYAAEVFASPGTVLVPITVDNFNDIDAISLALDFDNTAIDFVGLNYVNPALSAATASANVVGNTLFIGWNDLAPVTIPGVDQELFILEFNTITGTYPLVWNDIPDVNCEYQNALIQGPYNDKPTADFYINGFITDLSGTVSSTTNVVCKGDDDGTVTLAASGGSYPMFIYKLTNNSDASYVTNTDGMFTGVAPGTYTASVIDADYPWLEVEIDNNIVIEEPLTALTGNAYEYHPVRCKNESNGQAAMFAEGGWGGLLYSIDGVNYQTYNKFDALAVGVYTLYVQDVGGCVITDTVAISEPSVELTATGVESKVVSCKGGSDGEITLTGFGGWGSYKYSKNNLNYYLSPTLTGFPAGAHTVYVKDDNHCVVPVTVTVTEPADPLVASASPTKMVTCWGYTDGEITVTATGGWFNYEYSKDNINWQTSNVLTDFPAGSHVVYVRDLHGCVEAALPVTITEPDHLVGVISGDNTVCHGDPSTVTVSISGGTTDYTFYYQQVGATSSVGPVITNNPTFSFTQPYTNTTTWNLVSLTDANGCTSTISGSATITVNPLPVVTDLAIITDVDDQLTTPTTLDGDLNTGFEICVDPVVPFHYLGISSLTNTPVALEENYMNEFFLVTSTLSQDFWDYWDDKDVDGVNNANGWELAMWEIINGNDPMFYMEFDGTNYVLVDGLQYLVSGGLLKETLRISGDYPQGLYSYTGTVRDQNGCISLPITIDLQMNSSPVVQDFELAHSVDETNWYPVAGNLTAGFEVCVDAMEAFHYLDVTSVSPTVNPLATGVMNEFFLNTTALPTDFYTYWDAQGVNAAAVGGWEEVMWNIIDGTQPMFYMEFDGTDYMLIDGLQYQTGQGKNTLRISGDYPAGTYTFTGTVEDINGCVSSPFSIELTMITMPQPDAGPDFTVCNSISYELEAVQLYNGVWTFNGPGTATFSDDTNVSSTVTVDVAGTYTFTWTENNGICYKADDVDITFLKGTLADDYEVTPIANIEAVSGAPIVTRFAYELPTPDVTADANITMDGMLSLASGTFPAGMNVIEARRVAPITTTWFNVVDGDMGGKDHILLSDIIGIQNPLFNNELNEYNWVLTIEDANGTTGTLDMNFSLVTYITKPSDITADCYAILDQASYTVTYNEALISAPDAATCDGDPLYFSVEIEYPAIDNVDDNMEILLDAKISLVGGTFNPGTTLHWGYNDPPTNTSTVNVDGISYVYLSDIVGITSGTPMANHTGTDVWNFVLHGLDVGVYDLDIEAIARITVVEPPLGPLQIPGSAVNPSNPYPAPDPADYTTYEYAYATQAQVLTVNPLPTITLITSEPKACHGEAEVELGYTATDHGADQYSIEWGTLAAGLGFANVSNATLPVSPIVITIPTTAPAGIYEADFTVRNSITGCVSAIYPIEIHVPAPFDLNPQQTAVTCFGHNDGQAAANVTGSWGGYTYLWDDPAAQTTDPAVGLYAGVYTVIIADAEGCSTTAAIQVTQPDELDATVTPIDITCHGLTDGIIEVTSPLGGYGTFEYRIDADAWSVTPTFTGLAAGSYDVQIRDAAHPHCWKSLGMFTIVEPPANVISGYLNYPNLMNTPLNNVTVELYEGTTHVYSAVTDANGFYSFPNVCNGTYDVIPVTAKPILGAVNATDATHVNLWAVSPNTIPVAQFISGDVVVDGDIDGGDASFILEYFLTNGQPTTLPWPSVWTWWNAGDYVSASPGTPYGTPQIVVSGTQTEDFLGIVTGDFNLSFIPGTAKSTGGIAVTNNDGVVADGTQNIEVPVTVTEKVDVTAISLILDYPADKVEVVEVLLGSNSSVSVPFNIVNSELRIGYYTAMPLMLDADDVMLTLVVRPLAALTPGENAAFTIVPDHLNELADGNYQPIHLTTLNIPVIQGVVSVPEVYVSDQIELGNFPNPFNQSTTITYNIPVDGEVTLAVYDLTGRRVKMLVDQRQHAGAYQVMVDASDLGAGIYMANLLLNTEQGVISRTIRIVAHK